MSDRPSVTPRADCGCDLSVGPNALHIVDDHDGAAARAETTTEAIERIARETAMTGRDALELVEAVQALQDAETTTATDEDAALVIHKAHCVEDEHGDLCIFWGEDHQSARALADAGLLLATARTRPTRDDLARAIASGYETDHPTPNRHDYRAADAVLALLRGGA